MTTVYIIKQVLQYGTTDDHSEPFCVLFGYATSYEVVRWFAQNRHRFHSEIVVEQWEVHSDEELFQQLCDQFALDSREEPKLFYLELRQNRLHTLQKPLYVNQDMDVSSYAYTLLTLVEDAIYGFIYRMLCMRIHDIKSEILVPIMKCLRLLNKYLNDEDEYGMFGLVHLDDTSVLIHMIENDDDGDNSYFGY